MWQAGQIRVVLSAPHCGAVGGPQPAVSVEGRR